MQVKIGGTETEKKTSGTYDGIHLDATLWHGTANTAIAAADYKPENVQIRVVLKTKDNGDFTLLNGNLLVLGLYKSIKKSLHYFVSGFDLTYPASGVYAKKLRTVFLPFGGHHRVDQGDELIAEVTVNDNAFTANLDSATSQIEFYFRKSIGVMTGIYMTKTEVVSANVSSQPFSLGDNVVNIALLNLDKDTIGDNVVNSVAVSSDKWDMSLTYQKMLALRATQDVESYVQRYGATPPTQSVFRFADLYPQSMEIFNGTKDDKELDNCDIELQLNSANVAASKNWVCSTKYYQSKQMVVDAINRTNRHTSEKLEKLPA